MSASIGGVVAVRVDGESSDPSVEYLLYYSNVINLCTMHHTSQSSWIWEGSNGSHKIHFLQRDVQTCNLSKMMGIRYV